MQVDQVAGKAGSFQGFDCSRTADAAFAMNHSIAAGINLRHAADNFTEWDVNGIWNLGNRHLERLAHVDNLNVFATIQPLFEFRGRDLRHLFLGCSVHFSPPDDSRMADEMV